MNVLVTGGSRGIGKAITELLLERGHTVTYTYATSKPSSLPKNCSAVQFDLFDPQSVKGLVETVRTGGFDALVNNASPGLSLKPLSKLTSQELTTYIASGIGSTFDVTQAFVTARQGNAGAIVNVLTSYTLGRARPQLTQYITYKYALLGLHQSLAAELLAKKITVNAVSPSMVETDFVKGAFPERYLEMAAEDHPQGRLAKAEEVANLIYFLLNEKHYIHGANLPVTGGLL